MKLGPVAVLVGVLVGAGGLALLLYEAGKLPDVPAPAPAEDPQDTKTAARRVKTPPPPPLPDIEIHPAAKPRAPVPSDALPRYRFEQYPDLQLRNWKEVGAAFMETLVQHREMAEKGMPTPDPEDAARVEAMRPRAERMMSALFSRPAGLAEGRNVTPIDHPAFAVNLAAAVLEHSKMPLTEAQGKRLSDLAVERSPFVDKADAAIRDENDPAWMLDRIAARARVIEGFYAELYSALTPAQGEALSPELLRNRTRLDLASPAASWMPVARPMFFANDDQLVGLISHGLANDFKVLDREAELRAIVEAWTRSDTFPAADLIDRRGFLRTSHVAAAAVRMTDLLNRIVDGMKLGEEAANFARLVSIAYVPLRN